MISIIGNKDIKILEEKVGSRLTARLNENRNFFMPLAEKKYFLSFHWFEQERVTIYADKQSLLIMTDSDKIKNHAQDIDVEDDGIMQLFEFFLEITGGDVYKLESMENVITNLEDKLLTMKKPSTSGINNIISVRKDLLKMKRYYEQMEFLTDEIAAIDPTFNFIDKKFDRLLEFVQHLQEYIEQVREAYQSQIDIEQNSIMKFFTVITSIFLPLTLIVGWYGMNLQMPEFGWKYGYAFVIGLCVVVTMVMIYIFKKKKWF